MDTAAFDVDDGLIDVVCLALELADVLFVLLVIANQQEIELEQALNQVLDKYKARDADRWRRVD